MHGPFLGNRIGRECNFRFGALLVDGCVGAANIESRPVAIPDASIKARCVNRPGLQSSKEFSSRHVEMEGKNAYGVFGDELMQELVSESRDSKSTQPTSA